jgi:hypothetical protein
MTDLYDNCIVITMRARVRGEIAEINHAVDRELLPRIGELDHLVAEFRPVAGAFLKAVNSESVK